MLFMSVKIQIHTIGIQNRDIADHRLTGIQLKGFKQDIKSCNILMNGKRVKSESVNRLLSHIADTRQAMPENPDDLPYAAIVLQNSTIARLEYYKQKRLIHDLRCPDLQGMQLMTYNPYWHRALLVSLLVRRGL